MNILLFGWGCALACLNTKVEESSKYWIIIPLKRFPPPPLFQQGPSLMLEEGEAELRSGWIWGPRNRTLDDLSVSHLMGLQRTETFLGPVFIRVCFQQCWQSEKGLSSRREAQVTGSREGRLRRKWSEGSHFSLTWKLKSEPLVRARY